MPLDTLEQNTAAKSKSKAQKKETKKRKNAQTSHEDVKELCAQAVRTKIQKKNCESYKYYKKALAIGGVDATCMRNAKTHISTFASECD